MNTKNSVKLALLAAVEADLAAGDVSAYAIAKKHRCHGLTAARAVKIVKARQAAELEMNRKLILYGVLEVGVMLAEGIDDFLDDDNCSAETIQGKLAALRTYLDFKKRSCAEPVADITLPPTKRRKKQHPDLVVLAAEIHADLENLGLGLAPMDDFADLLSDVTPEMMAQWKAAFPE